MSDFWSTVLGTAPPPQHQAPVQAAVPWWQQIQMDLPEQQAEPAQAPVPTPDQPVPVDPTTSMGRTQWARENSGPCPGCGSSNYSRHPEQPNARPRCFDCGYPIMQSGSGVVPQGDQAGPVAPARQTLASRTNNFNPHHITQHVHPQQKG